MSPARHKIRIGVVGAGYWGPNLLRNLLSLDDVEVAGVADLRPGRLQYIREKFGQLSLLADGDALLTDPAIDAVMLATPVSTHASMAVRAIEHGKHVFVEKPLARSVAECDAILSAAAKADRTVAVGHIFVYHPGVEAMREALATGRIGRPCYVESARVNLGPPASEVNVMWDLLVHDLSILLDLLPGRPTAVTAFGRRFIHPTLVDAAFVHLTLSDGTMTSHHVSWLSPEKVRRFFVAGSGGSLTFNDAVAEGKLRYVDQGVDSRVGARDHEAKDLFYRPGEVVELAVPHGEPLSAECRAFVSAVQGQGSLRNGGVQGRAVVAVLEAAEKSIAAGSTTVPLREL